MLSIKDLLEKRARKITEARAVMDGLTDKSTTEERHEANRQFRAFMDEAKAFGDQAENQRSLAAADAQSGNGDPRRPTGEDESRDQNSAPQGMEYRQAFHNFMLGGGHLHGVSQETRAALQSGLVSQAIQGMDQEERAQIVGSPIAGGHLVPDETNEKIIKAMADWGPMYDDDFATVIHTDGGGTFPLPGVDDTDGRASKTATEGAKLLDTGTKDVEFSKKTLGDFMYDTEFFRVSIQLMTGGFVAMDNVLGTLLGERLGRTANAALTLGTGAGEPLGIVPGAGLAFNPAGAASVTAEELQRLVFSVNSAYRRSPKFGVMFNDDTLLKLYGLKDGQGNFLLSAAPNAENVLRVGGVKAKFTVNDDMPNMGTGNRSMIAGDMSKYYVRKIGRTMILTAHDSQFLPGFGIAGYNRFDGTVADENGIKALQHP